MTERSTGQLVYFFKMQENPKRGGMVTVSNIGVFRQMSEGGETCVCSSLEDGVQAKWQVKELSILPMTESVSNWELTTYVLGWLTAYDKADAQLEALVPKLLQWKGGERGIKIRQYLLAERRILAFLERESKKFTSSRAATQMKGVDRITDYLDNSNGVLDVVNSLVAHGDFFAACSLLMRFDARFHNVLKNAGGERLARQFIQKWEENLLAAYVMAREDGNACETAFRERIPDARGLWNRARPVSVNELGRLCGESYACFMIVRGLSPVCDFPLWGKNILGVLAMLPGDCQEAADVTAEFESALRDYDKSRKNSNIMADVESK